MSPGGGSPASLARFLGFGPFAILGFGPLATVFPFTAGFRFFAEGKVSLSSSFPRFRDIATGRDRFECKGGFAI